MKVIKRDGRAVEYNSEKIKIAIDKANQEVRPQERATKEEIKEIINYIEELGKKRILFEDIQDIIEEKLMEINKYKLAKKYIVYRYTRALVRKQNTTDESILGLIRNENNETSDKNKDAMLVAHQRDYIAGEVSRDLTKRLLLPEKIIKAHQEGILYFHNADYFLQPIINSSIINIGDMLDNGTIINKKKIESPKSFQEACIVMTQIIAVVASNQYGEQTIDMIHLGKYLKKSYDKIKEDIEENNIDKLENKNIKNLVDSRLKLELKDGIKIIQYQLETLRETNIQAPFVNLLLHLDKEDPYIKENAMIIEEILIQRGKGIENEKSENVTPQIPKLTYILNECNCLKGGEYDYLTRLAVECSYKGTYLDYISDKCLKLWKSNDENYKFEGKFNQGMVSINLQQIEDIAKDDEEKFWQLLEERLELCKEALMCRHYALVGTKADVSPILWKHGGISRLKPGEKIDKLLYGDYSTMFLGYDNLNYEEHKEEQFLTKLSKKLKDTINKWKKENNIKFVLYTKPLELLSENYNSIEELQVAIQEIYDNGQYVEFNKQ